MTCRMRPREAVLDLRVSGPLDPCADMLHPSPAVPVVFGLGDAVFFPASMAITPELVPGEQLVGASALNQTSTQLARV